VRGIRRHRRELINGDGNWSMVAGNLWRADG
jgi:hypothetical protein